MNPTKFPPLEGAKGVDNGDIHEVDIRETHEVDISHLTSFTNSAELPLVDP